MHFPYDIIQFYDRNSLLNRELVLTKLCIGRTYVAIQLITLI